MTDWRDVSDAGHAYVGKQSLVTRPRGAHSCATRAAKGRERRGLRERTSTRETNARMTTTPNARCRVLLVEDEALIAMMMEDMLEEFACEVSATAGELDQAIEAARTQAFDMAFVDINLRGVPAWPVAEVLRERGIPFAFVTGYGTAETDPAHA